MRIALALVAVAVASCNCSPKLNDVCTGCPTESCIDGKCACQTDKDCAVHYACFSGTCLCADSTCIDPSDSGSTGGGGGVTCFEGACGGGAETPDSGAGGGGAMGGGMAAGGGMGTGGGSAAGGGMAGCGPGTKECLGSCVPDATCCNCCYACDAGSGTSCAETQADGPSDGGACPAGFSHTSDCIPCWDCRTINGYCPNQACCGSYVTTGVVATNCTCYGCTGFAFDHDKNLSCEHAQFYSHDGGPPEPDGGLRFSPCVWPAPGETAFCGYYPNNSCTCFLNHCGGACEL